MAETSDDFAFIEDQLAAYEAADRDTSRQKATLEILTQQAAAYLIGVSSKHLRDHQPARNADGTYNGPDIVQWIVDRTVGQAKKDWEKDSDTIKTSADRIAEAKATKYEEEAKGVQGRYVEKSEVSLEFAEMASAVRAELEALPRAMAPDFPAELRTELTRELTNQVKQILRRLANRGNEFNESR